MEIDKLNELSQLIIGSAIKIHKKIGPGLLESAYEKVLTYDLRQMDLSVEQQVKVPLNYEGLYIPDCYRLDLLVNNSIIIEVKSIKELADVHKKQLLTYLKLTNKKLGLLINFNEALLTNGIRRIIN